MKTLIATSTLIGAMLVPTFAQADQFTYDGKQYFSTRKDCERAAEGRITGGIVGGIAGALIGDNISGSEDEGAAIGAVVGALVGSEVGARTQKRNCYKAQSIARDSYTYRNSNGLRSKPAVLSGARDLGRAERRTMRDYHQIDHSYRDNGRRHYKKRYQKCGYGERLLRAPNGRVIKSNNVYMCKRKGKPWRIVDRRH